MITINDWFDKNAKRPLYLLVFIVLSIQVSFVYHYISNNEVERTQRVKNLVNKIANTAIEQKNRSLIEATFSVAVEELGAKQILLCHKEKVFIGFPYSQKNCTTTIVPSFFERKIEMDASGYSDYKFIFYIPKWYISSTFIWLVLLTSLSVVFFLFIVLRIRNKLQIEVFRPLEGQFFSKEKMNISELDKLRHKVSKAKELDKKRAKLEAKHEIEHKFAHNIQSPLRNIKILKER